MPRQECRVARLTSMWSRGSVLCRVAGVIVLLVVAAGRARSAEDAVDLGHDDVVATAEEPGSLADQATPFVTVIEPDTTPASRDLGEVRNFLIATRAAMKVLPTPCPAFTAILGSVSHALMISR